MKHGNKKHYQNCKANIPKETLNRITAKLEMADKPTTTENILKTWHKSQKARQYTNRFPTGTAPATKRAALRVLRFGLGRL